METYLYPVHEAILHFPILAFFATLPYIIFQYRRYGAVSFFRSLILFSFFFYLLCAYYLTILPLPDPASVAEREESFTQLIPFRFLYDFATHTKLNLLDTSTYLPALKQSVFYEPLFNVVLTLPFGVYLAYYFKRGLLSTLLLSFALSLFFEVSQITGLFGIYAKPYRLFDVDDLLLNTLGGVAGYGLSHLFRRLLPSREKIDAASKEKGQIVSYSRRAFALWVDAILIGLLLWLLSFCGTLLFPDWMREHGIIFNNGLLIVLYPLYFILLQGKEKGRTPGKALVKIRTVPLDGWPLMRSLSVKYLVTLGTCFLLSYSIPFESLTLRLMLLGAKMLLLLLAFIDLLRNRKRGKRLWYERLSHSKNESTLSQ